jgi:ABC-2 type transport system permease protein
VRLYVEVAKRAFQRQLAYRTANLAGLVTNAVFGYLRALIILALFEARGDVAGYDATAALSYTWATQATIMCVALWGWYDVEETIRSGDVVSDLARPFSYLGYWLARDLGRAAYFFVMRCLPVVAVAVITFGIPLPSFPLGWLAWMATLLLATVASFGFRMLVNLTAFWTADARGLGNIAMALVTFLSGFIVPLPFLPPLVRDVCLALPFAAMVQTPSDVFVGKLAGASLLSAVGLQLAWCLVLLAACQLVVAAATRRVFVQGG